jgi:hypothetical protein
MTAKKGKNHIVIVRSPNLTAARIGKYMYLGELHIFFPSSNCTEYKSERDYNDEPETDKKEKVAGSNQEDVVIPESKLAVEIQVCLPVYTAFRWLTITRNYVGSFSLQGILSATEI